MKKYLWPCLMFLAMCYGAGNCLLAAKDTIGIQNLGHVGIEVTNLPRALHFYENILGFTETFSLKGKDGKVNQVYLHVGRSHTFVELFVAGRGEAPVKLPRRYHFGFFVNNLQSTLRSLKARGYPLPSDAFKRAAKAAADGTYLYFIFDPDGNRIEFSQITPDSFQGKVLRGEKR